MVHARFFEVFKKIFVEFWGFLGNLYKKVPLLKEIKEITNI